MSKNSQFEINKIFDRWSKSYDKDVKKKKNWLFHKYEETLDNVLEKLEKYHRPPANILEIGAGTGNLTIRLLKKGYKVTVIEPSEGMIKVMLTKIKDDLKNNIDILKGDFLNFPIEKVKFQAIVSTFAWHHIEDEYKLESIDIMKKFLDAKNGVLIIADFMFKNLDKREEFITDLLSRGEVDKVEDIKSEYYANLEIIIPYLRKKGFKILEIKKISPIIWMLSAQRI